MLIRNVHTSFHTRTVGPVSRCPDVMSGVAGAAGLHHFRIVSSVVGVLRHVVGILRITRSGVTRLSAFVFHPCRQFDTVLSCFIALLFSCETFFGRPCTTVQYCIATVCRYLPCPGRRRTNFEAFAT